MDNEATTLRANLAHLYPHAHEIVICEGSIAKLRDVCGVGARSDDGTLEIIESFPDPDHKITLLQQTWSDKNEMSAAYAEVASGDIIWHVDADEFYDENAFHAVREEFAHADLLTLDVPMYVFWKSPDYVLVDESGDDRWFRYARVLRRTPGMSVLHIPVRRVIGGLVDEAGRRGPSDPRVLAYHYAWNSDARVRMKMRLYEHIYAKTTRADWIDDIWCRWSPQSSRSDWPDGLHPSREWKLWAAPFTCKHPKSVGDLLGEFDCLRPVAEAL